MHEPGINSYVKSYGIGGALGTCKERGRACVLACAPLGMHFHTSLCVRTQACFSCLSFFENPVRSLICTFDYVAQGHPPSDPLIVKVPSVGAAQMHQVFDFGKENYDN